MNKMIKRIWIYLTIVGITQLPVGLVWIVLAYGIKRRSNICRRFALAFCWFTVFAFTFFTIVILFNPQDNTSLNVYGREIEIGVIGKLLYSVAILLIHAIPTRWLMKPEVKNEFIKNIEQ
jgi:hypothetical protein